MPSSEPTLKDEMTRELPKHEQLRDRLIREITEGRLKPGAPLPTEHEMSEALKISRNTVRQALAVLEQRGLIYRVRGRGTYVHDAALLRMNKKSDRADSKIFALLIPDTRGGYYPSLQRGFGEAAMEVHHQMIVCDTGNDPYRQADSFLQLIDKQVTGVALVPTLHSLTPAHQIRPLQEGNIPVVFCHRRVEGIKAPLVCFSGYDVGYLAGRSLVQKGHRRVAFFTPSREGLASLYEEGLRSALREVGADLPEEMIRSEVVPLSQQERDRGLMQHLDTLLELSQPPTAIFCSFDTEAEHLYLLLNQRGIAIPNQISLIGFGGSWREGALNRRITSVTVDEEALGRHAVRLLHLMREGKLSLKDETEITMPLSLSEGMTLGEASILY